MNQRETLKLALEALEVATTPLAKDRQEVLRAQAAIREALAEQPAQQEPVAWMWMLDGDVWDLCSTKDRFQPMREGHVQVPLYTSPPAQRKPLTDEEIYKIANDLFYGNGPCDTLAMCRAIEAAHGIKEST